MLAANCWKRVVRPRQEQDRAREIADLLSQLPQQQTDARRQLNELGAPHCATANGNPAQNQAMQAESAKPLKPSWPMNWSWHSFRQ